MPELRKAPLPHDLMYFLDSALEFNEINAFDHLILTSYGNSDKIDNITSNTKTRLPTNDRRRNNCAELDCYAHQLANDLPDETNRSFFAGTIIAEKKYLEEIGGLYGSWNYDDNTTGGALKPWFKKPKLKNGDPTPRIMRRLFAPSSIRRYVKYQVLQDLKYRKILTDRLRALPWPNNLNEADFIQEYLETRQRLYHEFNDREIYRLLIKKNYAEKKVVKKSFLAAKSVIGNDIDDFIKGKPIRLVGQEVVFEIIKADNLFLKGHGGLKTTLYSLEGDNLAGLCIYFSDMSVLDQVACLALGVQSGDEKELIEIGNIYNLTKNGLEHPIIKNRKKKERVIEVDGTRFPEIREVLDDEFEDKFENHKVKLASYLEKTQNIYMEAVGTRLWEKDYKRFMRLN